MTDPLSLAGDGPPRSSRGRRALTVVVGAGPCRSDAEARAVAGRLAAAQRYGAHPLVQTVVELGFTDDGTPWYATPRLRGSRGGRRRPAHLGETAVDEQAALRAVLRAGDALAAIHDAGGVHGEVSPAHLLRDGDDTVLQVVRFDGGHRSPPEGGEPTVATDVWGLTATLAALVGGDHLCALEADPARRPQSVRELCEQLRWVERSAGYPETAPSGVTLLPLVGAGVDIRDLGWSPVIEALEVAAVMAPARKVPARAHRDVRRSLPAVIGAASLAVAATGVAYAAAPATTPVTAVSRPSASPAVQEPEPWDDPAPTTAVAFTVPQATTTGTPGGTVRIGVATIPTIDPGIFFDPDSRLVIGAVFAPLVAFDDLGHRTDDGAAASSVTHDAACTTWTVRLKPGRFSDGTPVDAAAYRRGWTHAATFGVLYGVTGSQDVSGGFFVSNGPGSAAVSPQQRQGSGVLTGFTVVDASTFRVHLDDADCAFDTRLAGPQFSPTSADLADATTVQGGSLVATDSAADGPFVLSPDRRSLVRNPTYAYGTPASLDRVDLVRLFDSGAEDFDAYRAFQKGTVDVTPVPATFLTAAHKLYGPKGGFLAQVTGGSTYLSVSTRSGPLADPVARRAVSLAIDRDALIADAFDGFAAKADGLVPPTVAGHVSSCDTCGTADPVLARQLAASAGLVPGTRLTLSYQPDGSDQTWVHGIQTQLETVLGIDVSTTTDDDGDLAAVSQDPADDLFGATDAAGLLAAAIGRYAHSRYQNPAVDALLAKSGDESALVQAQQQAVGVDLAALPLWWSTGYRAYDPTTVAGVQLDPAGNLDLRALHLR